LRPTGEWLNQPGGLAERLVRIRKAAGLTGDQLAAQLSWPRSKVPKLENGRQMPKTADITAWAQACGQPEVAQELLAVLAEAESVHRQYRHQLRRGGHAAVQRDLDKLVRQAKRIRNFETLIIPGLLQTPDYARYRLREIMQLSGDTNDAEDAVAARMHRQEVLYETGREFEFIIMETALLARTCPDEVMLGQLDRLMGVPGLSNVTFGIVPLGALMSLTPVVASFLVLDDLTYVETYSSEDLLQGDESAVYGQVADRLRAESVTGEAARELITSASQLARVRIEQGE
jgi:transcriptional regulator with XRE-family HTH domain